MMKLTILVDDRRLQVAQSALDGDFRFQDESENCDGCGRDLENQGTEVRFPFVICACGASYRIHSKQVLPAREYA